MSSDDSDLWMVYKAKRQEKRAHNRKVSAQMLAELGIPVEMKNHGAHIVLVTYGGVIDFWPGTGLWSSRNITGPVRQRGIDSLIIRLKEMGWPTKP